MGPRTITIDYTTVVLNVSANQSGATLTNDAIFQAGTGQVEISAANLNVVTPRLILTKTASPKVGDVGGPPITFTLVLSHDVTSTTDAFNVTITDPLPSGLIIVPGSLVNTAGRVPTTLQLNGSVIDATFDQFPLGSTSTIQFQATLAPTTVPGHVFKNTADSEYTSLPGNVLTPISPYNPVSTERTGNPNDPGGAVNDLASGDQATVTLFSNRLAGTVFVDLNNNGILNSNDPLISGVILTLTGPDNLGNLVFTTTTTDVAGQYAFTGLPPGNYVITETQPAGYLSGINTVGSQGGKAAPPPSNVLSANRAASGNLDQRSGQQLCRTEAVRPFRNRVCRRQRERNSRTRRARYPGSHHHTHRCERSWKRFDSHDNRIDGSLLLRRSPAGHLPDHRDPADRVVTTINTIGTQGGTVSPGDALTNIVIGPDVNGTGNKFGDTLRLEPRWNGLPRLE